MTYRIPENRPSFVCLMPAVMLFRAGDFTAMLVTAARAGTREA
jgi:ABC-type proline/glycine betaine transport system permease subunit